MCQNSNGAFQDMWYERYMCKCMCCKIAATQSGTSSPIYSLPPEFSYLLATRRFSALLLPLLRLSSN